MIIINIHTANYNLTADYIFCNGTRIASAHPPAAGYCEQEVLSLIVNENDQITWTGTGNIDFAYYIPFK